MKEYMISVEEQMPPSTTSLEDEVEILAFCRNTGKWHIGWYTRTNSGDFWALYPGSACDADVTHWMYVPDKPG